LSINAIKIQKRGEQRIEIALNVLGDWSLCVSFCEQWRLNRGETANEIEEAKTGEKYYLRTVGRKPNEAYRVREHLTETEVAKLLAALKGNRHGQRHWLIGLLIYRHGLRVSEACDLRWDDFDAHRRG
jgi:integrase